MQLSALVSDWRVGGLTCTVLNWTGCFVQVDDVIQSDFAIKLIQSVLKTAVFFGSVMYSKELKRIAELLNIPIGKVILLQLAYEAFAACTSIVANGDVGHPLHIRTMDWSVEFLTLLRHFSP